MTTPQKPTRRARAFLGGDAFIKQDGREHGDDQRRSEDKDVEHGQREMAEGDDHADVVCHVQQGAQHLAHH
jgi:hypothetical protein